MTIIYIKILIAIITIILINIKANIIAIFSYISYYISLLWLL